MNENNRANDTNFKNKSVQQNAAKTESQVGLTHSKGGTGRW